MSDSTPHMNAGAERLLEESLERQGRTLDRRARGHYNAGHIFKMRRPYALQDTQLSLAQFAKSA